MIKHINHLDIKYNESNKIKSYFHFSIGDYYNPENVNFGKLRILNDEVISPKGGFDLHPHRNLEILTLMIEGEMTHRDSLNNEIVLKAGDLQYMSAGKGIVHSEINKSNQDNRLLQIWILPSVRNLEPKHNLLKTNELLSLNEFVKVAGSKDAPIIINQDANIYLLKLEENNEINFEILEERQAYLVQIEGRSNINGLSILTHDALEIIEENITIKAEENSYIIIIEMKKE